MQWASAAQAPEGLKAIAPAVTTTDYYRAPWYSDGGAMSWQASLLWTTLMATSEAQRALAAGTGDPETLMPLVGMLADLGPHLRALPAGDQPLLEKMWPWWSDWLAHPNRDGFWRDMAVSENLGRVSTPAMNIGGWFDVFVADTARTYTRMKAEGGSAEARSGQRLVIGPWDHMGQSGAYPDRQFGLAADSVTSDLTGEHIRFYDRWLRGRTDALDGRPPVRIFVMGLDQWRDEPDWPLPDTQYVDYHLTGSGRANTAGHPALVWRVTALDAAVSGSASPATPRPGR